MCPASGSSKTQHCNAPPPPVSHLELTPSRPVADVTPQDTATFDSPQFQPQLHCSGLNGAPLLERAIMEEAGRFLMGNDDDCEGQELTLEHPPHQPPLADIPHHVSQLATDRALAVDDAQCTPSSPHAAAISPDRRRRNQAAAKRKQRKRVAAATSPYEGRSSKTRSGNIKKLEGIAKTSVALDLMNLPAAGPGSFVGRKVPASWGRRPPSPKQLIARGFTEGLWDGVTTVYVGDKKTRCFVIFVGRPTGKSWDECVDDAARILMKARVDGLACGGFKLSDLKHRRGSFLAFASGVSFGGGQKSPGNLVQPAKRAPIIQSLLDNALIRRIAGFQSQSLATFAPRIFNYMQETLKKLFTSNSKLKPNFNNSIYPTITFNCGPDTACVEHVDHGNAAHMLCAVTALGNYDPSKGGHLVLYPLKRFYRFPPGSTVLLPSAMVAHGNTPISKGEFRCSVTQYCPGGLLRWVEYGFCSVKSLLKEPGGATKKAKIDGPPESRFEWALGLFSKLKELVNLDEEAECDEKDEDDEETDP